MMINLKWPQNKENFLLPWYKIFWAFLWIPVIYIGITLTTIGIFMSKGKYYSSRFLQNWDNF